LVTNAARTSEKMKAHRVSHAHEAGMSRIYAGDHFRFDHAAGKRLGRRIAEFALAQGLRLEPSNGARR
jgi:hypothetical protein